MSSTWKSLAVGFGAGVVSTGLYAFGIHILGGILWGVSIAYIGVQYYLASEKQGS